MKSLLNYVNMIDFEGKFEEYIHMTDTALYLDVLRELKDSFIINDSRSTFEKIDKNVESLGVLVNMLDQNLTVSQHLRLLEVAAYISCVQIDLIMSLYPIETYIRALDIRSLGGVSFRPAWLSEIELEFKEDE